MTDTLAPVAEDVRLRPLYTIKEAATYLGVARKTFHDWTTGGATAQPVIHVLPSQTPREAEIPFMGLTEGLVVAAFRRSHASMQYIKKALRIIRTEIGLEYALASQRLYLHGAQILWDHASSDADIRQLAEVVTKNYVFDPIVADYLKLITYGSDKLAAQLILPLTERPILKVDPKLAFGQPVFIHGAARMQDALDRFVAGDATKAIARDFDVPEQDLLDIVRVFVQRAA